MIPWLWVLYLCACDGYMAVEEIEIGQLLRDGPIDPTVPDCRLALQCPALALPPERCLDDASLFDLTTLEGQPIALALKRTADLSALPPGRWFSVVGADCDNAIALQFELLPPLTATSELEVEP